MVETLRALTSHREIMDRFIAEHGGRIANTAGDSVLAEFSSAVDAVKSAVRVQESLREANEQIPEDRALKFRIGVHVGDVLVRGQDLLGDAVNIAARLQSLAEPGAICISGATHDYVRKAPGRSSETARGPGPLSPARGDPHHREARPPQPRCP